MSDTTLDTREIQELRRAKVLSHPIRVRALGILRERPSSATELGRELGLPTQKIAYHLSFMLRHGAIEEVETRQVRGAIETFYRAIDNNRQGIAENAALPRAERDANIEQIERWGHEDFQRALATGSLTRDDLHVTRTMWTFDDQGRREAHDLLDEVLDRFAAIQDASVQRIAAGAPVVKTTLNMTLYDPPAPDAP